jgi:hypothetical protein
MERSRHIAGLGAVLLAAVVLLTGCGGGQDTDASDTSGAVPAGGGAQVDDGGAEAGALQPGAAERGAADSGGAGAADVAGDVAAQAPAAPGGAALDPLVFAGREVVFTADLSVRVDDVAAAASRAEDIVGAAGGLVAAEETTRDPDAPTTAQARLTVRVPPEAFRRTLAALAALGQPLTQTQTAQDVTEEVTDLDSRLATQRASVERVRALLGQAQAIEDIVRIESELARREAELESLQARRARLGELTALSTITVTLSGSGVDVVTAAAGPGFLEGLRKGWAAFRAVVVVMLTVLGGTLPFVLVGALILVPLLAWHRRRRRALAPSPEAVAPSPEAAA